MKLRNLGTTMLLGSLLMISGCSGDSKKKDVSSLALANMTVMVNDTDVTIYQGYGDLLEEWTIDEDNEKKVSALDTESVYLTKKDNKRSFLTLHVYNPKDEEINIEDAIIMGFRVSSIDMSEDVIYGLPNGMSLGKTTMKDTIEALGYPLEYDSFSDSQYFTYASSIDYEAMEYYTLGFKDGVLSRFEMKGNEKKQELSKETSFETKQLIGTDPFEMPLSKGDGYEELAKGNIQFAGIDIKKGTPVTKLLDKGCKIDHLNANDDSTSMTLKKDSNAGYLDITVSGEVKNADSLSKDNVIENITIDDDAGNDAVTFSKNITSKSTIADVLKAYGTPSVLNYREDSTSIKYRNIGNGFSISLNYSKDGKLSYCNIKFNEDIDEE